MYTVPVAIYNDLLYFLNTKFLKVCSYIQLQLSLFFFMLDIRTFSVWYIFRLCESIGLLCTEVKYLI